LSASASDLILDSEDVVTTADVGGEIAARSPMQLFLRRFREDKVALAGAIFIVLLILVWILNPLIRDLAGAPNPNQQNLQDLSVDELGLPSAAGPSAKHLLGTDQLGRDLLSRIISGTRPTLLGSIALLAIATALGVLTGITAAWHRGWVDSLLARVTDVMYAFPGLLFVIMIIAVFKSGATTAVIGLGLAYAPPIAKFTRAIALEEMARPYVDSYRLQGVGGLGLCARYLLPNMLPTLVGYLVVLFGEGLMSLASLNFLGFGSQPPSSDWGLMVEESRTGVIQGVLGPAIVPALAIAIVVVATNVVGVRLSDKLAVRK
jgi:ABC-type dipeptide/oligopeptide/nickel transport system permease subunit